MNIKYKLLIAILVIVGCTLAEKYYHFDGSKQKSSNEAAEEYNNNQVELEAISKAKDIEIGQKIETKHFYNYETKHGTSIHFSTWGKTNQGSCTFTEGNVFTGNSCRFTFSYVIENGQINAKFSNCSCEGRTTTDRTFYYDESRDVISTTVNGQTFEFAPDGSPYMKRGRRNIELSSSTSSESESYQSESGYTTGSDGRVYENAPCSLCNGTGVEKSHGTMGGGYGRKCPQCDGRGHQNY